MIGLAPRRGLFASSREVFSRLHASDFGFAHEVITALPGRCGDEVNPLIGWSNRKIN
jgi:hypothetical protein